MLSRATAYTSREVSLTVQSDLYKLQTQPAELHFCGAVTRSRPAVLEAAALSSRGKTEQLSNTVTTMTIESDCGFRTDSLSTNIRVAWVHSQKRLLHRLNSPLVGGDHWPP
mmetsp:Transcript_39346/g.58452  ORF Transcript_39346/g.58452 Transcript_39346/m.58452 type:complete len:111 (+) Transcript_39346:1044-1376(+)